MLTTGRNLVQYNVGTQTRRTHNNEWSNEDVLEIHPSDAEMRGIKDQTLVFLEAEKVRLLSRHFCNRKDTTWSCIQLFIILKQAQTL